MLSTVRYIHVWLLTRTANIVSKEKKMSGGDMEGMCQTHSCFFLMLSSTYRSSFPLHDFVSSFPSSRSCLLLFVLPIPRPLISFDFSHWLTFIIIIRAPHSVRKLFATKSTVHSHYFPVVSVILSISNCVFMSSGECFRHSLSLLVKTLPLSPHFISSFVLLHFLVHATLFLNSMFTTNALFCNYFRPHFLVMKFCWRWPFVYFMTGFILLQQRIRSYPTFF